MSIEYLRVAAGQWRTAALAKFCLFLSMMVVRHCLAARAARRLACSWLRCFAVPPNLGQQPRHLPISERLSTITSGRHCGASKRFGQIDLTQNETISY